MIVLPESSKAYRLLLVCLFILCLPLLAAADDGNQRYLQQLLDVAQGRQLANQRDWRVLLHYADGRDGESRIDDPLFFLSSGGKKNPAAELVATLEGFFAPATAGDDHPRCRFPAREAWLTEQLGIDLTRLSQPLCAKQDDYLKTLNPRSASIMFPAAYLNSPASMFGHTYIRIDGDYESELLSYAINYAAETAEQNGMVYAWKGVFGAYKGYFSILPQYAKVREYANLEHRDIWDYRLNLSEPEVRQMARHIWELQRIYSDYYFFDENCSYNLLFLLEAARPSLHLTDKTSLMVIPLDTIMLARDNRLISSTGYRPSQGTKIRVITRQMTGDEIVQAQKLARGEITARSDKVKTLDLAIELLQFSYNKQEISQEVYRPRLLALLNQRSAFGLQPGDNIATPPAPEQGHESSRVSLGSGFYNRESYLTVGVRPAYHGLDDAAAGYVPGAEIQFFNTILRYTPSKEQIQLQQLKFVDITSLSDYEPIFRRTSWNVSVGLEQVTKQNGNEVMALRVNSGAGMTTAAPSYGMIYAQLQTEGLLGEGLRDWCGLGAGLSAGILKPLGSIAQLHLWGRSIYYPLGEKQWRTTGNATASLFLSRNNSLEMSYLISDNDSHRTTRDLNLVWHHYF